MKKDITWKTISKNIKSFTSNTWNEIWNNRKYFFYAAVGIITVHIILIVAFIIAINKGVFGPLPDRNQLQHIEHPVAAEIYTADSVMMGKYYLQNRMDLKNDEVTPEILDALIATEDIRFYEHSGIDTKSLLRVLVKTLMLQNDAGGGSTITQQLAKNLYPRRKYPVGSIVINKLREMVVAVKLEKLYSKEEILLLYLNTVPFGEDTYGIKSGALRYFRKNPKQLNTEEIALLVGMLKGTTVYNPRSNYDRAIKRRNVVLHQMNKYGRISDSVKDSLVELPITLNYYRFPVYAGIAPYFRAQIKPRITEILNEINEETGSDYHVDTDGLKIYTTINSQLQQYAEMAVNEHLKEIQKTLDKQWEGANWEKEPELKNILDLKLQVAGEDSMNVPQEVKIFDWEKGMKDTVFTPRELAKYNASLLQSGFLAMDNHSGNIMAWVGGIDHQFFEYDHVTAKRQAGSTFKPFLYLAALEQGFHPCDTFTNERVHFATFDGWSPHNSDHEYGGMYSMKGALTHSVNTVSAKLMSHVNAPRVIDHAYRAGIETELPDIPSLALGTAELSLLEMVNAYQTIANKGKRVEPKFIVAIENQKGNLIYTAPESARTDSYKMAGNQNIEILIRMMKNVVDNGTASRLRYRYNIYTDVAGKTGTTQDHADGWFIGFTPDITAGVRVGTDYTGIHFKTKAGQGAYSALPIWAGFFSRLYADQNYKHLEDSRFSFRHTSSVLLDCPDYIEPPDIKIIKRETIKPLENLSPSRN
ncbi:MAG: transglycosylase domain-containing protein [Prolixibacteraceae bacterium]